MAQAVVPPLHCLSGGNSLHLVFGMRSSSGRLSFALLEPGFRVWPDGTSLIGIGCKPLRQVRLNRYQATLCGFCNPLSLAVFAASICFDLDKTTSKLDF